MEREFTEVYCGSGKGKTTLAIGQCLRASAKGKSVIIIQFLKGRERRELDFLEQNLYRYTGKMWEKQPVFENASHEKAWLISTTKNYCLDVLKSSWHKKRVALDINREIMSDEREQEYPVLDEILKLPQKYREVLYLYYYEEYSVKEIGIMLKRKESTIQSRLAAGRNKLKTRLADRKGVW